MNLTKRQQRFVFIYLTINFIALLTNFFQVPIKLSFGENKKEIYLFSDACADVRPIRRGYDNYYKEIVWDLESNEQPHFILDSKNFFWPLTSFYFSSYQFIGQPMNSHYVPRFRGLFPDYDFSEFAVYIGALLIFLLYKRYWK
ncbi:MAG: hypothetical protein KDB92_08940 [Chitinophagaceae bacterium]|nr:hypothetical protein [Chitinophagaceae bacterium]